jgi:hypothetical protein
VNILKSLDLDPFAGALGVVGVVVPRAGEKNAAFVVVGGLAGNNSIKLQTLKFALAVLKVCRPPGSQSQLLY